ncbi:MAG: ABC transporter substrate-binding protein [Nitrincola sp.]|nr:ABC transporter substrate-binding protein [Nitrincola sp.]
MKLFKLFLLSIMIFSLIPMAYARETLRLGMHLEPPVLDPTQTPAASAGEITYGNLFEGLLIVNGEGELQPRLASQWDVSNDGLIYRFVLRRGVRFHDNNPFTAEVARFSIQRMIEEESKNPQKMLFNNIASVDVEGLHLLKITLYQPDPFFLSNLALPAAVIVHPNSAENNATHPIGTGPYKFVEWIPKRSVRLSLNERYWGKKPAIKTVDYLFMQTSVGTESLLAEGLIDGLLGVTRVTNRFVIHPDYRMIPRNLESKMILAINNARAPFNDRRARQALAHGINRQALTTLYGSQFNPELIGSHFSPRHPAYLDLSAFYEYNPDKAINLLREAGIEDGYELKLTLPPTDYGRMGGLMIADDLESLGFRVVLEQLNWIEWMDRVFKQHDYSITLILHVEPMDINIYARDNYYFNYDNERFKAIWNNVLQATSNEELYQYLGQAQRQLAEDAVNVFLFMRPERNFMHRNLRGMWKNSYIPSFVLEDLYWVGE